MPPNFRDVLRRFDGLIDKNKSDEALSYVFEMIQEFDAEREYSDSINVLHHIADSLPIGLVTSKAISHLLLRCMLTGDTVKLNEFSKRLQEAPSTAISEIVLSLIEARENSVGIEYILDGIERQSIFGKFEPLLEVPFLEFKDENAVHTSINDHYPQGRYIVNLIQSSTNFHHAVNVDVGIAREVNIVEKRRLMKFD